MLDLEIDSSGLERIVSELDATPAQIKRAFNSTVRKVAAWLKTRSIKGLSAELQIQQKVIRRRLKQAKLKTMPDGIVQATVWYGLNPISLAYLQPKKTSDGVSASGGRRVKGGFIAKGGNGKKIVFKRTGKSRLPIEKQEAHIEAQGNAFIDKQLLSEAEFEKQFWKTFEHELNWAAKR